jgi:hypothetical protein
MGGRWHCRLRDEASLTASWAQGGRWRSRPGDGVGFWHCGLENGVGCTVSWARGGWRCCGLENGVTGFGMRHALLMAAPPRVGKMAARKSLDHGQERWCVGSGEDSMTAWMLRGGLGDNTGSGEVNDGVGSREIFGGKFWQPDEVSENLRGLGFANAAQ